MNTLSSNLVVEDIYSLLRNHVVDPELMVNIVDLGLVYEVQFNPDNKTIQVKFTLTSPGCPMGEYIYEEILGVLNTKYPDSYKSLDVVWDPLWTPERISEEGRKVLGM